jgi:hypothetical protein
LQWWAEGQALDAQRLAQRAARKKKRGLQGLGSETSGGGEPPENVE